MNRSATNSRRAFTLIEMLAALTIGTMILAATASLYVATLDNWRRGSQVHAQMQAIDKIGMLLERHLRAAVSPAIDSNATFYGEDLSLDKDHPGHRLTLLSSAPGRFPRNLPVGDTAEVEFEYDPSLDEGLTMRIQCPADDLTDEGGYRVTLSPLVRGFTMLYFDGQDWIDTWSKQQLPRAVEFHLLVDRPTETGEPAPDGQVQPSAIEVSRLVWMPTAEAQSATTGTTQTEGGNAAPSQGASNNRRTGGSRSSGRR